MNKGIFILWLIVIVSLALASWNVVITVYADGDNGDHAEFFFVSGIVSTCILSVITLSSVWILYSYMISSKGTIRSKS